MARIDVSVPSGMRDVLPQVAIRREWMFECVRTVFRRHGFLPIETPAIERAETLLGKYGTEADKLLYFVQNSGSLHENTWDKALRYDLTVPLARYVVRHRNELVFPFKRYQIQNVWRGDRPQKGRYREFFQCDVDVVGSDSLTHEADLTEILYECLTALGVNGFEIRLNHRALLFGLIDQHGLSDQSSQVCIAIDKLDKIGPAGVLTELSQRGIEEGRAESLLLNLQTASENGLKSLPELESHLQSSSLGLKGVRELSQVESLLRMRPDVLASVRLDLTLARGLDYYTGTIFEVVVPNSGFGSICGGGRYANLTKLFGWSGGSGVGVSLGIDRIYDVLESAGTFQNQISTQNSSLLVALFDANDRNYFAQLVFDLRQRNWACEWYENSGDKLKKQFSYADRKGFDWVVLAGETERMNLTCKFKQMSSGAEHTVPVKQAINWLLGF